MIAIRCVHQGTEMYGSDKSFAAAVAALAAAPEIETSVLIPHEGAILDLFATHGITAVDTRDLWVLRKAGFIRNMIGGLPRNLGAVSRAISDLRASDLVYVNTTVIVDFLLASVLTRKRVVVHVREIPQGMAMRMIRALLIAANARTIFNSRATSDAFALPERMDQAVVYNGFPLPTPFEKEPYDAQRKLRLLCIGRLNSWKGQTTLVRACAVLSADQRARISVRIVGGVYKDQVHFRDNLRAEIAQAGLEETIEMVDFVQDPSSEYVAADVVVVPSTLPEPFGRVAIEGMAFRCAVVASDHGGLQEIVVNGGTGYLLPPGNEAALAEAIVRYLDHPDLVAAHGDAGAERFATEFTQAACDAVLLSTMRDWAAI